MNNNDEPILVDITEEELAESMGISYDDLKNWGLKKKDDEKEDIEEITDYEEITYEQESKYIPEYQRIFPPNILREDLFNKITNWDITKNSVWCLDINNEFTLKTIKFLKNTLGFVDDVIETIQIYDIKNENMKKLERTTLQSSPVEKILQGIFEQQYIIPIINEYKKYYYSDLKSKIEIKNTEQLSYNEKYNYDEVINGHILEDIEKSINTHFEIQEEWKTTNKKVSEKETKYKNNIKKYFEDVDNLQNTWNTYENIGYKINVGQKDPLPPEYTYKDMIGTIGTRMYNQTFYDRSFFNALSSVNINNTKWRIHKIKGPDTRIYHKYIEREPTIKEQKYKKITGKILDLNILKETIQKTYLPADKVQIIGFYILPIPKAIKLINGKFKKENFLNKKLLPKNIENVEKLLPNIQNNKPTGKYYTEPKIVMLPKENITQEQFINFLNENVVPSPSNILKTINIKFYNFSQILDILRNYGYDINDIDTNLKKYIENEIENTINEIKNDKEFTSNITNYNPILTNNNNNLIKWDILDKSNIYSKFNSKFDYDYARLFWLNRQLDNGNLFYKTINYSNLFEEQEKDEYLEILKNVKGNYTAYKERLNYLKLKKYKQTEQLEKKIYDNESRRIFNKLKNINLKKEQLDNYFLKICDSLCWLNDTDGTNNYKFYIDNKNNTPFNCSHFYNQIKEGLNYVLETYGTTQQSGDIVCKYCSEFLTLPELDERDNFDENGHAIVHNEKMKDIDDIIEEETKTANKKVFTQIKEEEIDILDDEINDYVEGITSYCSIVINRSHKLNIFKSIMNEFNNLREQNLQTKYLKQKINKYIQNKNLDIKGLNDFKKQYPEQYKLFENDTIRFIKIKKLSIVAARLLIELDIYNKKYSLYTIGANIEATFTSDGKEKLLDSNKFTNFNVNYEDLKSTKMNNKGYIYIRDILLKYVFEKVIEKDDVIKKLNKSSYIGGIKKLINLNLIEYIKNFNSQGSIQYERDTVKQEIKKEGKKEKKKIELAISFRNPILAKYNIGNWLRVEELTNLLNNLPSINLINTNDINEKIRLLLENSLLESKKNRIRVLLEYKEFRENIGEILKWGVLKGKLQIIVSQSKLPSIETNIGENRADREFSKNFKLTQLNNTSIVYENELEEILKIFRNNNNRRFYNPDGIEYYMRPISEIDILQTHNYKEELLKYCYTKNKLHLFDKNYITITNLDEYPCVFCGKNLLEIKQDIDNMTEQNLKENFNKSIYIDKKVINDNKCCIPNKIKKIDINEIINKFKNIEIKKIIDTLGFNNNILNSKSLNKRKEDEIYNIINDDTISKKKQIYLTNKIEEKYHRYENKNIKKIIESFRIIINKLKVDNKKEIRYIYRKKNIQETDSFIYNYTQHYIRLKKINIKTDDTITTENEIKNRKLTREKIEMKEAIEKAEEEFKKYNKFINDFISQISNNDFLKDYNLTYNHNTIQQISGKSNIITCSKIIKSIFSVQDANILLKKILLQDINILLNLAKEKDLYDQYHDFISDFLNEMDEQFKYSNYTETSISKNNDYILMENIISHQNYLEHIKQNPKEKEYMNLFTNADPSIRPNRWRSVDRTNEEYLIDIKNKKIDEEQSTNFKTDIEKEEESELTLGIDTGMHGNDEEHDDIDEINDNFGYSQ